MIEGFVVFHLCIHILKNSIKDYIGTNETIQLSMDSRKMIFFFECKIFVHKNEQLKQKVNVLFQNHH